MAVTFTYRLQVEATGKTSLGRGISFLMGQRTKCLFVGCICVYELLCNIEICCFKITPCDGRFSLFLLVIDQKSLESTTNKCSRGRIGNTKPGSLERQKHLLVKLA